MWNYVVLFLRNCKGYVLTEGEIHEQYNEWIHFSCIFWI